MLCCFTSLVSRSYLDVHKTIWTPRRSESGFWMLKLRHVSFALQQQSWIFKKFCRWANQLLQHRFTTCNTTYVEKLSHIAMVFYCWLMTSKWWLRQHVEPTNIFEIVCCFCLRNILLRSLQAHMFCKQAFKIRRLIAKIN